MKTLSDISGLGLTRQREVVFHVILESENHLTANEVFNAAKSKLPSISFATVYNSLRFLKDAGHIAEINFGNGATRFDKLTFRHDHALCTECGKLVDMHLDLPEAVVSQATKFSNFKLESLEVTLRGKCPECSN